MINTITSDAPSDTLDNIHIEKNMKCGASMRYEEESCIPLDYLVIMANQYNKLHPTKFIDLDERHEVMDPSKYKKYLVNAFTDRFSDICNDQKCWLKQKFIENVNKDYQKLFFVPDGPNKGSTEWLSTTHIDDVMKQYTHKYNNFKYLGTVPIDFDKLPKYGIHNLDFDNLLKNNKTKIGCVFNLDRHDQSGSHWVGMFSDLSKDKQQIYFFDSYGIKAREEIRLLMKRICEFLKNKYNTPNDIDYRHNKIRHQFKGSECGVYSMHFILRLLEGKTFDKVTNNVVKDDIMNKYRDKFFY
jgi:hypothetical protein